MFFFSFPLLLAQKREVVLHSGKVWCVNGKIVEFPENIIQRTKYCSLMLFFWLFFFFVLLFGVFFKFFMFPDVVELHIITSDKTPTPKVSLHVVFILQSLKESFSLLNKDVLWFLPSFFLLCVVWTVKWLSCSSIDRNRLAADI